VLGGVEIRDAESGLTGHSDADVLTHAVMDALLGAAALGDLGEHFPDHDPQWQDAASLDLLFQVGHLVSSRGYAVRGVDATVIAERPRLAPYREEMRHKLADSLRLAVPDVGVKFTTNEGMGFVGRGEGIAALAVATVEWMG
jgi:2-C-methyl-D-erythritol 2,4-cyclodiphosphate synthase